METIRDVLGEDPPVLVNPQIKEGNVAKLLIDLSEDADVLVVGSRGHGGFSRAAPGIGKPARRGSCQVQVVVVR